MKKAFFDDAKIRIIGKRNFRGERKIDYSGFPDHLGRS